jgi:putative oxidoreductase
MMPLEQTARRSVLMLALAAIAGCVQPAYDRTVLYQLDVSKIANVRTVAVRGRDHPLSWDADLAMRQTAAGRPYTVAVTYHTGYLVTEVKFVVNGDFELAGRDNRTVRLARTTTGGDTTVYQAVFDTP